MTIYRGVQTEPRALRAERVRSLQRRIAALHSDRAGKIQRATGPILTTQVNYFDPNVPPSGAYVDGPGIELTVPANSQVNVPEVAVTINVPREDTVVYLVYQAFYHKTVPNEIELMIRTGDQGHVEVASPAGETFSGHYKTIPVEHGSGVRGNAFLAHPIGTGDRTYMLRLRNTDTFARDVEVLLANPRLTAFCLS